MKKKIINKIPHHSGYEGFHLTLSDGSEWSVLNFADSMKTHPYPEGLYLGWEALSDKSEIVRAKSFDGIVEKLLS